MATLLALNRVYAHTSFCTEPGQVSISRRYWRCFSISVADPLATVETFAFQLDTALAPNFKALLNNTAQYYGSQTGRVDGALPFEQMVDEATNRGAGSAGAIAAPKQTTGLIALHSGIRGRTGQGRIYVPFPAVQDMQGVGEPTLNYITRLDNLGLDLASDFIFLAGLATIVMKPTLFNPALLTHLDVVAHTSRRAFASQRRRGDYGSLNATPF